MHCSFKIIGQKNKLIVILFQNHELFIEKKIHIKSKEWDSLHNEKKAAIVIHYRQNIH